MTLRAPLGETTLKLATRADEKDVAVDLVELDTKNETDSYA